METTFIGSGASLAVDSDLGMRLLVAHCSSATTRSPRRRRGLRRDRRL